MFNSRLWKITNFFGSKLMVRKSLMIWLAVLVIGNSGATLFAQLNDGHGIVDFAGYANILSIKKLWLTTNETYALLSGYSELGRQLYYIILAVDFFVPLTGALFFISAFSYFFLNHRLSSRKFILLSALPVLFILSDYFENTAILLMLYNMPEHSSVLSRLTSVFLSLKFGISSFSCIIISSFFLTGLFASKSSPKI